MTGSSFDWFSDDAASDADPNEIAKILKETEDMDGDLFKNTNKPTNNSLAKTMPAPGTSKMRNKSMPKTVF